MLAIKDDICRTGVLTNTVRGELRLMDFSDVLLTTIDRAGKRGTYRPCRRPHLCPITNKCLGSDVGRDRGRDTVVVFEVDTKDVEQRDHEYTGNQSGDKSRRRLFEHSDDTSADR